MEGIADALNSVRGFNIACQVVVQSLSQWQQRYPGKEWENQLNTFNQTIYMGCQRPDLCQVHLGKMRQGYHCCHQ